MSVPSKSKFDDPSTQSRRATALPARASAFRLLPLLLVGLVLIGTAWGVRSSRWVRETALRGKDLPDLEAAVRARPDDALAQYYLAKRYYLERRFPEARDAYTAAVRLDPSSARAHLGLGLTLFELGDMGQARSELAQALQQDSHLAWAEYMLGKIAWLENNLAEAVPHVKRATQLDPRSDQAWYGLGICYIQLRRYNEAMDAMRQAVARNEASPRYHTALGELLVYRGNVDEGRKEYERALQLNPDYGPACGLMGSLYMHKMPGLDSLDRAEALLLKATSLDTYHPQDVYFDLGQLYIQKGQFKKAVEALQQSIRIDPRDERPYYILAKAYRRLGDTKSADATEKRFRFISERHVLKESLEASLSHVPEDAANRLRLARVYRDLGLSEQAVEQYAVYLRQHPDDAVRREFNQLLQEEAQSRANRKQRDFVAPHLQ